MHYEFVSVDKFLFSIETEIINTLYDYSLLKKFDRNVKKIIFYIFVKRVGDYIVEHPSCLFYHNNKLSSNHELFSHFEEEKLTSYFNKICTKLKKVTKRVLFLNDVQKLPESGLLFEQDGNIIDEIILLESSKPVNYKELSDFLESHSLKDLFSNLSKKV
jgi:hypothetical protein